MSLLRLGSSLDDDYEVKYENNQNLNFPLRESEFNDYSDIFSPLSRKDCNSYDEDSRDSLSPLFPILPSSPDQLSQFLRHRLREYKSTSPKAAKSRTKLSDRNANLDHCLNSVNMIIKFCDSTYSSMADMIINTPQDIGEIPDERFRGIEYELQDLTSEMDEWMSSLSIL